MTSVCYNVGDNSLKLEVVNNQGFTLLMKKFTKIDNIIRATGRVRFTIYFFHQVC